jgi:uncharacterized protein
VSSEGLPARLSGLLEPAAYPHRPAVVELRETHISWVLLAADRAYKLKKPLRLPFLDYGSLGRRHELCRDEVRLNRRLAPEVYRGVRAVLPAGHGVRIGEEDAPGALEYAVEMRRFDEHATLARRHAGEAEVQEVGRRLAAFHATAAIPAAPERTVGALEATLEENFSTLRELGAGRVGEAGRLAGAFLAGRRDELRRRAREGLVRDGHGDLRAEQVLLERGIEIVDCVEFDPALREIDVGFDLAFLAMDLMRRDERPASVLVTAYRAAGDPGDDALLAFFAAQRALIRAKVSLVRAGQVRGADADRRRADAGDLLELAGRLGWRVRLGRLAVVCGPAASGKSTLARALASHAGASVLASDLTRKELLGVDASERAPASAYGSDVNRRTYAELGRRARERLAAGEHVVVDATFRFAADRRAFADALGQGAVEAVWIECRAPAETLTLRAAAREREPGRVSDADATIAERHVREWEPLSDVPARQRVAVETDRPPQAVVAAAAEALEARLRAGARASGDDRDCLSLASPDRR